MKPTTRPWAVLALLLLAALPAAAAPGEAAAPAQSGHQAAPDDQHVAPDGQRAASDVQEAAPAEAVVAGAVAADQAQGALTLEQAIAAALEGNHDLAAATAGQAAAEAGAAEARAGRLPGLAVSETASRTTNPVMVFGGLLSQEAFGAQHFDPAFLNRPDPLNNFSTRVMLSQPLWTGGRLSAGIGAAESAAAAARHDREAYRQLVISRVTAAYSGAVLAERGLEVAREARKTAAAHVKLVGDLFEGGMVVRSDLLQAQVRESETAEMVAEAEARAAVARAGLNLAMGRGSTAPLVLPREVSAEPLAELDPVSLTHQAEENRADLAAARARAEAARLAARGARAERMPEVGLAGIWEANAEDFVGGDGNNWTVMLSARLDLFDGGKRRARRRAAEARAAAAREMAEKKKLEVGLDVTRAYHAVRAARQRVALSRQAVELAEAGLKIVEDRYREGLTTLVELLSSQTALTEARMRRVAAERDLLVAQTGLRLAAGLL